jgi:hypothetical protein
MAPRRQEIPVQRPPVGTPMESVDDVRALKEHALLLAQDRVNQTYEEHGKAINEVEELRRELGLGFHDKE